MSNNNSFGNRYLNDKSMIRHGNIINSHRYDMDATEINLFFALLFEMKRADFRGNKFSINIQQLIEATGTSKQHYIAASEKLLSRTFTRVEPINEENEFGNKIYKSKFVSSVIYNDYNNIFTFEVSGIMIKEYETLKGFTEYQIKTGLNLNSKFSKRLYSILAQYKNANIPEGQETPVVYLGVLELKKRLGLFDEETGEEKFSRWSDFKKRVLELGQKELQEQPEGEFFYTWCVHKKRGKKIEVLKFNIISRTAEQKKEETNKDFILLKEKCFLSDWQARKMVATLSHQQIREAYKSVFYEISGTGSSVKNVGGYCAKTFNNMFPELGFFEAASSQKKMDLDK